MSSTVQGPYSLFNRLLSMGASVTVRAAQQRLVFNDHLIVVDDAGTGLKPYPQGLSLNPHADVGTHVWPLPPPYPADRLTPEQVQYWLVHYDNLLNAHGEFSVLPQFYVGSVRGALAAFLSRGFSARISGDRSQDPTRPNEWISYAHSTHIIGVQPVGTPYLRVFLPSDLFLTRAEDGQQVILLEG